MGKSHLVRRFTITSVREAQELEQRIRASAATTCEALHTLLQGDRSLDTLRAMKFRPIGVDPLDTERSLNVIEQLNQTFTYLASVRGVEYLLRKHPEHAPYRLNLGTSQGPDIASVDGRIVAETFAAVSARNNRKHQSDLERLRNHPSPHRYLFYYSERSHPAVQDSDIYAIPVEL